MLSKPVDAAREEGHGCVLSALCECVMTPFSLSYEVKGSLLHLRVVFHLPCMQTLAQPLQVWCVQCVCIRVEVEVMS